MDVPAVAVAEPRVLAIDLEGAACLGRAERVERPRRNPSHAAGPVPESPARRDRPALARARRPPSRSAVDAVGQAEPVDLEIGGVGVALDRGTGRTPCRASRRAGRGPCRRVRPDARRSRASSPPGAAPRASGGSGPPARPGAASRSATGRRRRNTASGRGGRSGPGAPSRGARSRRGSSTGRSPARPSASASLGKCSLIRTPGVARRDRGELAADLRRARRAWGPRCRAGWARPTGRSGCTTSPGRSPSLYRRRRPRRTVAARPRKRPGSPSPVRASIPARRTSRRGQPSRRRPPHSVHRCLLVELIAAEFPRDPPRSNGPGCLTSAEHLRPVIYPSTGDLSTIRATTD